MCERKGTVLERVISVDFFKVIPTIYFYSPSIGIHNIHNKQKQSKTSYVVDVSEQAELINY